MTSFNGGRFIRQQIQSIQEQTLRFNQLIICDDGSSDNTKQIIKDLQKQDARIKLIENKENLGVYRNFEKALLFSKSEYIFLSDQDDIWFKYKLALHIDTYSNKPELSNLINDALMFEQHNKEDKVSKKNNLSTPFFNPDFVQGCCVSIRKEVLEILLPFPDIMGLTHDEWIFYVSEYCFIRGLIEEPLQYYRRHEKNDSISLFNQVSNNGKLKKLLYRISKSLSSKSILKRKKIFIEINKRKNSKRVEFLIRLYSARYRVQNEKSLNANSFSVYFEEYKLRSIFYIFYDLIHKPYV